MGKTNTTKKIRDVAPYLYFFLLAAFAILFVPEMNAAEANVNQNNINFNGVVVDESGVPVIGAYVKIPAENSPTGEAKGTVTDYDGKFNLSVSSGTKVVFSYIGFKDQSVTVKSSDPVKIVLVEDVKELGSVVFVGYAAQKRENLTGSVSTVNMDDLEDQPVTNLTSLLMGTMPGVNVSEPTGNPLADASLSIRTTGTWNDDFPLYVIDGFVRDVNAFNDLDASEVASITILKDASAAVYGVRGSGGVVLVTTKRGRKGKTKVTYSGSVGFSDGLDMPDMMSSYQQAKALNDLWSEDIRNGSDSSKYVFFSPAELNDLKSVNHDWLDEGWSKAYNTRHTVNVSGGSDKTRYFIGGSYRYAEGNFSSLERNSYNFRAGLDVDFTDRLTSSINFSYSYGTKESPLNQKDSEPDLMYGTFSTLTRMPRWIPSYINGLPVGNGLTSGDQHPLEIFNSGSYKKSESDNLTISGRLNYDFKYIKGLKASVSLNYGRDISSSKQIYKPYNVYNFAYKEYTRDNGEVYTGRVITDNQTGTTKLTNSDKYYDGSDFGYTWQINPELHYDTKIGRHNITAMYVMEVAGSGSHFMNIYANDIVINNYENLAAYTKNTIDGNSGKNNTVHRMSHIMRLNYDYAGKYIFESTLRYEASTNFAPDYRWGLFGSVSGGWRMSEEDWFKDALPGIENLKIRASYGRLGNDKVSLKQWRQSYEVLSDYYYLGTSGLPVVGLRPAMNGLLAYNSEWEKTDSYDAGIDMNLYNGLSFTIDGFYKHTYDILDDAKSLFPQSSGISGKTPKLNYGIQNAWGYEFEIGYDYKINDDWSINANASLSYAMNKVIKKYQNPGIIGTWQDEEGTNRGGEVGYKLWKGSPGKGFARTWDDVNAYKAYLIANAEAAGNDPGMVSVLGRSLNKLRPGMLMYQDRGTTLSNQTPDGTIDSDGDYCKITKYDNNPYAFSFSLGAKWKSLSVSALFTGDFGTRLCLDKGFYTDASGGGRKGDFFTDKYNQLSEWYGNYAISREDGSLVNENAKYPRLDKYSFRGERSDFWLMNGTRLRLRTVKASYSVPEKVLERTGMAVSSCKVFFTANNLWTIINPFDYKDAYVGFWSDYPQIYTCNFGLNLTF